MEHRVCGPKLERWGDRWSVVRAYAVCCRKLGRKLIQMTIPPLAELVLRRADGSFLPASYLLSTLCHEVRSPRFCILFVSHLLPR